MKKYALFDIVIEIEGLSMIIMGLYNQLEWGCDRLTDEGLRRALCGVSNYLERIADSIEEIDKKS